MFSFSRLGVYFPLYKPMLWIRIRIGSGFNGAPGPEIRIRIRNPDPDKGGQKWQKNREKKQGLIIFIFWSADCSLLRAEGFSCCSDVLIEAQGYVNCHFLTKKDSKKIFSSIFFNFRSSKPWIRIQIRIEWLRIHNTGTNSGHSKVHDCIYLGGCQLLLEVGNLDLGGLCLPWLGLHGCQQLRQMICLSERQEKMPAFNP